MEGWTGGAPAKTHPGRRRGAAAASPRAIDSKLVTPRHPARAIDLRVRHAETPRRRDGVTTGVVVTALSSCQPRVVVMASSSASPGARFLWGADRTPQRLELRDATVPRLGFDGVSGRHWHCRGMAEFFFGGGAGGLGERERERERLARVPASSQRCALF